MPEIWDNATLTQKVQTLDKEVAALKKRLQPTKRLPRQRTQKKTKK